MIRPSLKRAIERVLDCHAYLGRSDFLVNEYQKDNEFCLAVAYRSDRKHCFAIGVKNDQDFLEESRFNITMSPGREAFEQTAAIQGRPALLEELKAWQQRVHEDLGVFPISRQFEAHIRRIGRMESCLGLGSKNKGDSVNSFYDELSKCEEMLQEFVAVSQGMHQSVLVWSLKTRLNEIKKLGEYLQVSASDPSLGGEVFALRGELARMSDSVSGHIDAAVMYLEKLDAGELCLVESGFFIPISKLFEADSKRLDEIRDRITNTTANAGSEDASPLIEELKSLHKRVAGTPATLMSYHNEARLKTLKRHLVAGQKMQEQFDAIAYGGDVSEIKQTLDQMRKDVSVLASQGTSEKEAMIHGLREAMKGSLQPDAGPALGFLEEQVRTLERTARTFLDDLVNPIYLPDHERAIRERVIASLIRRKQAYSAAIRVLKEDREANARFAKVFSQGFPPEKP